MAKVEILRCKGCGANLSPENTTCNYCFSENIVKANENPFNLDQKLSKQYANYFKVKVQSDPSDGNAVFSLGLFYLNLKLYELAIKSFQKAIELNPEEPEIHYYLALSMIKGRRPKTIPFKEIKEIEQFNNAALQLGNKAKYYYLAAIINFDFYASNGMKVPQPDYNELLNNASSAEAEPIENKIILDNVIIREEKLIEILSI
jgi:tetratricopeptide (TPR) repeat protein